MLAKKAEHNRLRKLLRRLLRKLLRMLLRKLLRKLLCKLLCKKKLLRGSLSIIAGFCWVLLGSPFSNYVIFAPVTHNATLTMKRYIQNH